MTKYLNEWSNTAGSNNSTVPDGWPEGMTSNQINNTARETLAVISRWEKDNNGTVVTSGTQPAYTATLNQTSLAAYYDGLRLCLDFHATNAGGAPNLNVNSIGAKNLVWPDGTALATNDITADMKLDLLYDGTNFQVLSARGVPGVPAANSVDGTMIAIGSDAVGDILYYDGTDYVILASGTDGYHLRANGAAAPTWEDPGTDRIVQVVNSQDGAVATGTTVMPHDDTIPQNTEGDEYMTLAITPTSATNELKIEITVNVSNSAATPTMTAALFQDSTAGALAATGQNVAQTGFEIMTFDHYMTAGTTSSTTFKVRVGGNGAGTTTFNGTSGARKNGGVNASSITITEITV